MRKYFCLMFCLFIMLFSCSCGKVAKESVSETTASIKLDNLTVSVLGIDEADCIVIRNSINCIMIDCGEKKNKKQIFSFLENNKITNIDMLVITHYDKDHIGAAADIIKNYNIRDIYMPDYRANSKYYNKLVEAVANSTAETKILTSKKIVQFGDINIRLLPAESANYSNENDFSIISQLYYGNVSMLFAGDAMNSRLKEYLKSETKHFDYIKIPHHGRFSEKGIELLKKLKPMYAVITASKQNPCGTEIISCLDSLKAKYFQTNKSTVTFMTDGSNEKNSTFYKE